MKRIKQKYNAKFEFDDDISLIFFADLDTHGKL